MEAAFFLPADLTGFYAEILMSEEQVIDLQQEHQKYIEDLGGWQRTHSCGN